MESEEDLKRFREQIDLLKDIRRAVDKAIDRAEDRYRQIAVDGKSADEVFAVPQAP